MRMRIWTIISPLTTAVDAVTAPLLSTVALLPRAAAGHLVAAAAAPEVILLLHRRHLLGNRPL